eukprot:CAMPEP_0182852730 /NCGR_PEP_ID=MMETSP0034_2-20130328/321_1 /TAXON_ID=156128 /ORGANISM="Nephroselmis pyriformis, Strain CCMP717" /LENGTH=480 /DNA_ID=CAMNT_0024983465 /DNA_START=24 /DNA_END=1466 /DNA_ORIENTATION=-
MAQSLRVSPSQARAAPAFHARAGISSASVRTSAACQAAPFRTSSFTPSAGKLQKLAASAPRPAPRMATRAGATTSKVVEHCTYFENLTTQDDFNAALNKCVEEKRIPKELVPGSLDFYNNYLTAIRSSDHPDPDTAVASTIGNIFDRVLKEFEDPYKFPSLHKRMLEPYNYYAFGQVYVNQLINYTKSFIGNIELFDKIEKQLEAGDNVVMLANHQTEADPGVWALLLENTHPRLSTEVHYVAGDRVVTDALCKPFSMGRNLLCVYSKKHMDDDPALKKEKQRSNLKTVGVMGKMFKEGGKLLWVAPSGGRDRGPEKGPWTPAVFDPSAVGLMCKMIQSSGRPGHIYPFAMVSKDIMPPPPATEKALGERRLTNWAGVGISTCPELNLPKYLKEHGDDKEAFIGAVVKDAYTAVVQEYTRLESACSGGEVTEGLTQPWAGAAKPNKPNKPANKPAAPAAAAVADGGEGSVNADGSITFKF